MSRRAMVNLTAAFFLLALRFNTLSGAPSRETRFEKELRKVRALEDATARIGKQLGAGLNGTLEALDEISSTEGSQILFDCLPKNTKSIVLINNLRQYNYGTPSACARKFGHSYYAQGRVAKVDRPKRRAKADIKDAFFEGELDVCSMIADVMNPFYCEFKQACPQDVHHFQVTYAALYAMQQLLHKTELPLNCKRSKTDPRKLGAVINPKAYRQDFNLTRDPLIVADFCGTEVAEGSGFEGSGVEWPTISADEDELSQMTEGNGDRFWNELKLDDVLSKAFSN